ncbi:probable galactinol--sucrose galactosyltransferase 2 [Asparagus officinalis]|uniref:probable galactinol--sucrose galactosyltransferase 2 n=1 Tax=Asparagus officinalis TaxID=4686 RepID=UPI00098E77B7|nr:probable galactinol--sucrose galactosyltransferase 2 [Asparagus officinalis]
MLSLHQTSSLNSLFLPSHRKIQHYGFPRFRRTWRNSMALATKPLLEDGVLRIDGRDTLTEVPENVVVSPAMEGAVYLGAAAEEGKSSRHVFKLGVLRDHRLLSLFRFKIWWMIPRMGNSASDVPKETQMLLLEAKGDKNETFYIVLLPVLDGLFRTSLQGNSSDELEFCIESGDPEVEESQFSEAVFVNYGDNPFDLMKDSMKILEELKGTFSPREKKKMPEMLDWFGWCTWDAFYFDVNPQGIEQGLRSLSSGGTPPRFLIIDDGWQDVDNEFQKEGEPIIEGSQWGGRLASINENSKFNSSAGLSVNGEINDMKDFITAIKKTFGLKYVYVWHALMGYWGGVHPNAQKTKKYNSTLLYPSQSPGNLAHSNDAAMDSMDKYGVAMIDPNKAFEFYDDLHSYLVSQKVDGVKVDVQNILETLAKGYGGRVSLTHQFQQALEKSISKNFRDNSIICCMGQNTDSIYSSKVSAITRASDDYMPKNETSQTLHVAAVAFNSIFLGEVVVPDWDMFYSKHYAAEFHAAARALGGCGVYVSDKPNEHDFTLLRKLVLPDGSVLRAKYPGRPTRDCLFNDPVTDGKNLLKIWNVNEVTGVLGVFNCQGAGSWYGVDGAQNTSPETEIKGFVSPSDVEHLEEVAGEDWTGDCAVYSYNAGSLRRWPKDGSFDVALKVLESEVFTISPIKSYNQTIQFAPIGLVKMYNSGGAVKAVELSGEDNCRLRIEGRGPGLFGAYSSREPKTCTVNSKDVGFNFSSKDNFLTLTIPLGRKSWTLDVHY